MQRFKKKLSYKFKCVYQQIHMADSNKNVIVKIKHKVQSITLLASFKIHK